MGAGRLTIEPQSLTQKQNPAVLYFPLRNQCYNGAKKKQTQKKTFRGCIRKQKDMESPNGRNGKKKENQLTQMATRNEKRRKLENRNEGKFSPNARFCDLIKPNSFLRLFLFYDLFNLWQYILGIISVTVSGPREGETS